MPVPATLPEWPNVGRFEGTRRRWRVSRPILRKAHAKGWDIGENGL
jgi:hypothetical protein